MKNQIRFWVALGAVLVVFLTLALALPFVKTPLYWIAFVFGVLAILIQLYSFPHAFRKGKGVKSQFYGFPIARLTVIYLAVQLVLSLLFMALAAVCPLWVGLLLCMLLLCAAVIGFVGADAMRDEVERQDEAVKRDVSRMHDFQAQLAAMAINAPADSKKLLDRLSEEFRYSDPVSAPALQEAENQVAGLLYDLKQAVAEGQEGDIAALCRKLSLSLAERNRLCRLNK